jgi:competence protein ComEC
VPIRRLGPRHGLSTDCRLFATSSACLRATGHVVALVLRRHNLAEDYWIADVVMIAVPVRGFCPVAKPAINRFNLWHHGGHALWILGDGGVRVESIN